ncbi:MAG: ssDNA-binding domain-containing protein [Novosphingobium sp.]|jgi:antirestriction protein ArdC|nr:ssDNA-binding domain-containing protein [Novosphingobium sp.]MCE2842030.1 ssDNA-binding domain-containing protein [Novosphingobium sp.]
MRDLHQTMTDRILASVDDAGQWKPCWHGMTGGLPVNAATGKRYNGVNILSLWLSGYPGQRWATYKQWDALGAQVQKGERGTPIIFYKVIEGTEPGTDRLLLRSSFVFNEAQVEGAPVIVAPATLSADQRIEALDRWIMDREHEIKLEHGGGSAFYRPSSDTIHMPDFGAFHTPEHYYAVLFHEATHWTGAKHRLDRLGNYAGEGRAVEELIAELGAAFLCAEFGIEQTTRDDHVSYIASWLSQLKGDKKFIVHAASHASKAVELLDAIQPQDERLAA